MAPPPNSGDANHKNDDDPLGGMDPMAWLESLAKRQGAKAEELTTAANLDVPLPPPDTVIDEPGYTPGYDTGKPAAKAAPPEPAAEAAKPTPPVKATVPEKAPEPVKPVAPASRPVEPLKPAASTPVPPPPTPAAQPAASAAGDDMLGGMDPMAWLESLAKRQGAKAEELTTAANLDVPLPPPDTVIDEPGYTPGYDTGKPAAKAAPPEPAAEAAKPTPPVKAAVPEKAPEPVKPVAPASRPVEPLKPAAPTPVPPPPTPAAQPAASAAGDDMLGGMDPMAWLESLAKRQGAKAEELTTAANLDVPLPPPGTVIDEPGYVDYDPFGGGSTPRIQQEPPRPVEPAKPPLPEPVVSAAPSGDLLGGIEDPLAWLESLTAASGEGELETAPTSIPGMADFSFTEAEPAPGMSVEQAAELLGIDLSSMSAGDDSLSGMDPLAWLESLTAPQAESTAEAAVSLEAEPVASTEAITEAGGASEDINEVKKWLEAQASKLEQTRIELEEEDVGIDELAPAEPVSELPDWLRESMPPATSQPSAAPALAETITPPVAPGDLPDWLGQQLEAESTLDASDFIRSLTEAEAAPQAAPITEELPVEDLESLIRPASPAEEDSWAVAFDEEHVGLEVVAPEWYMEARKRFEEENEVPSEAEAEPVPTLSGTEPAAPSALPDWLREQMPAPSEAPAAELPDWLSQPVSEEPELAPVAEAELPDWLREQSEVRAEAEALPGEIPDWLHSLGAEMPAGEAAAPMPAEVVPTVDDWTADVPEAMPVDLPDWLQPEAPVPAAMTVSEPLPPVAEPVVERAPTPPPAPVKPVVVEPVPPKREPVRPVLPPPTGDVTGLLQTARELVASEQHEQGLQHYQALIDSAQLLEETRGDLRQLIQQNPSNPRLHRLLGDTHMRLGDLQEALDTYRKALDQL